MKAQTLILSTLCALALSANTIAKDFPGVKSLMNADEFDRTGLNKLSAEELKALDTWLIKYSTQDVPVLAKDVPALQQAVTDAAKDVADAPVSGHIQGEFKGWKGKTVFKLDNGQIWKQRQDGVYLADLKDPAVRIEKNLMGFFELEIVESGKRIGVKRLK